MKKLFSIATLFIALSLSVISCKKDTVFGAKRELIPVNASFTDTPWMPSANPVTDTSYLSNPNPPSDTPYLRN